jgi:NADPH:quinone reductase-like Zn-dependent oxidoreductase
MKALLLTAPGTLAVADIDVPTPGPEEIVIGLASCWL